MAISPISIAKMFRYWTRKKGPFTPLMEEYRTFDYNPGNITVRILFSHFLAFMRDKFVRPEFFCWPGAWMAGRKASEKSGEMFERHSALFIDNEDDDGVFPRLYS